MKFIKYLSFLFVALLFTSCYDTVPVNHEGFYHNSWSGHKSSEILSEGTHSCGMHDNLHVHTKEVQSKVYESNVLSKKGLSIGVKTAVNWVNNSGSVLNHHEQYGLDGEGRFIDPVVYGSIKDVIGKYTAEEVYSTRREEIESQIKDMVNKKFQESRIFTLKMLEVQDVDLPQEISNAIKSKIKESQKTLRAVQEAETKKAVAQQQVAEAEARSKAAEFKAKENLTLARSLTPELIQYKKLQLEEDRVQRWNGVYPTTVVGESANMLFQLEK